VQQNGGVIISTIVSFQTIKSTGKILENSAISIQKSIKTGSNTSLYRIQSIYLTIHPFTQETFTEHFLCATHQTKWNKHNVSDWLLSPRGLDSSKQTVNTDNSNTKAA
jgi:hypothetical protein